MQAIKIIVGVLSFILGVIVVISPFLPPENICDVVAKEQTIPIVFSGLIFCFSGIFNVVKS